LFEQAIEDAPAKEATILYLMYAQTEEKYAIFIFVLYQSFGSKKRLHFAVCCVRIK
jgi:hypothetical protein